MDSFLVIKKYYASDEIKYFFLSCSSNDDSYKIIKYFAIIILGENTFMFIKHSNYTMLEYPTYMMYSYCSLLCIMNN